MAPYTNRATFFRGHLVHCDKCRIEWAELAKTLPLSRKNKALENVISANHHSENIIA